MADRADRHAIVMGGSLAGLLAARVLSDHFERVTIFERDKVNDQPECRKGQPQTRHLHGLLAFGLAMMTRFFPELPDDLEEGGAMLVDMGTGLHWYVCGGYRQKFESGLVGAFVSRAFLEWKIRQRVMAIPNVRVRDQCGVEGLLAADDHRRVTGVRAGGEHPADLVVDATGRGSATPKRLEALGYPRPEEDTVKVNMGYASRIYRREPDDPQGRTGFYISAAPPQNKRSGLLLPWEENRWILTLAGHLGDHAPTHEAGYMEYARSLAAPDIHEKVSGLEPLSDIFTHRFPSNLRRRYEKMGRFPEGYLVLGDAFSSFNPVYGQGMTSAALQASVLDQVLKNNSSGDGIWRTYFGRVARIVDIAWNSAVSEDLRFPEAEGRRTLGTGLVHAYVTKVQRATHKDPVVYGAFLEVMNLMRPPTSLFRPKVLWRVLGA